MVTTKKTGRLTTIEKDYKQSQGKDLFVKGFSLQNISEIIGIGVKTLGSWRDENNWEGEKELSSIKPSEIKKLILQYVLDIKEGRVPKHKADDLSKITAAFDRLNDSRKKAVYTMESTDAFSKFMMVKAATSKPETRDRVLNLLKEIRPYFDLYITELLQDD